MGLFAYDFDLAEEGKWDGDFQEAYKNEGIVIGLMRYYDSAFTIFVCGGNITQREADAICTTGSIPPANNPYFLNYGPALDWDTNTDYRYIPRDACNWENYDYLRISCPEGANKMDQCEYDVQRGPSDSCNSQSLLVIWCDTSDANQLELSFGGAKADLGLDSLMRKWLFN